ncbi:MAG: hypothetical protein K0U45_09745 [Alphaproteobacteria bacterium]|nr:hypothetical protein [Alphaproteobacteria bacterium]
MVIKKRGFQTKEQAQEGRARGHRKAKEFAQIIGMKDDYANDIQAKKDVIDPSGDSHSLKSGKKKWQIFLYSYSRISTDIGFKSMNGMGKYLIALLDAFPNDYEAYVSNKMITKNKLAKAQTELADFLKSNKNILEAFFLKSFFNSGEVNYLTIYGEDEQKYHVFNSGEIAKLLSELLEVANSQARNIGQVSALKTIFKYDGKNIAELEIRTESNHYREIRFNMYVKALEIFKTIDSNPVLKFNDNVLVYGVAKKKFGRWY